MKLVITGQYGMMGSRFLTEARSKGYSVDVVEGDLSVDNTYNDLHQTEEYIFVHIAGYKGNDKKKNYRNNILPLIQILDKYDFTYCKGFIFISSIAVIGNPKGPIENDMACNPVSEYGYAKKTCEEILKHYKPKCPCVIIRPTNVYASLEEGFLGDIAKQIINQTQFEAWSDSLQTKRDYICLQDVVNFIMKVAEEFDDESAETFRTINLGSGYAYSLSEIIGFYENKLGKKMCMKIVTNPCFASYDVVVDKNRNTDTEGVVFADIKEKIKNMKV